MKKKSKKWSEEEELEFIRNFHMPRKPRAVRGALDIAGTDPEDLKRRAQTLEDRMNAIVDFVGKA